MENLQEYQNEIEKKSKLSKIIVDFIKEIRTRGDYILALDSTESINHFINEFLLKFNFDNDQIKEINQIISSIWFKEELIELIKVLTESYSENNWFISIENSILVSSFIWFLHWYANKFNKNYIVVKYDNNWKPTSWNKKMQEETWYTLSEILKYYEKKWEVMTLLYKWENLQKVNEYLKQVEKTWKWYRNVAFTMTTKSREEKTFLWTTIPDWQGWTIRTARHLTDDYEIKKELEETLKLLRQDTLTLALNRRALENDFQNILTSERKIINPDTVFVIFDIDGFKKFNDVYSHNVCEFVLKELVKFILLKIRWNDRIYRLWWDEFVLTFETGEYEVILKKINSIRDEFFKKNFKIDWFEIKNIATSWWVKKINLIEMKSKINSQEIPKEIEKLKNEIDSYMYYVKYLNLIEKELLIDWVDAKLLTQKNSIWYPVFDENWFLIWINVLNSDTQVFIKKQYLDLIIERKITNSDKIWTRK